MKRILIPFLIVLVCLGFSSRPVRGQSGAGVSVLGRDGSVKAKITDGDGIQLRATLPVKATEAAPVEFFVFGFDAPVAVCTVEAGADSCLSAVFPALGWYWLPEHRVAATVNGQPLPGEATLEIAPRPVVMVHGFISSWETWQAYLGEQGYLASLGLQGFAVGDGQAPGVLNTGSASNPAGRTNSIAENAAILGQYIAAVQQQTGAEQVDLLVHSMGGMITRFYLDRVMTTDNVAQVIFLGTPHSGSSCVYPVAALGYLVPASIEIQPAYMTGIFNRQIVRRQGVPFHMIAGTRLLEPVTAPCTSVPSDTVVGIDSATSITLDSVQQIPLIHGDLTVDPGVFSDAVKGWLQAGPAEFAPRPDPAAPSVQVTTEQFGQTFTGHIDPGESQQLTIPIDPNVTLANFSLYDTSRSLQIEVRGASGNVIALDAQKNGELLINDPATMLYLGYGFPNPKPGAWVVTLMATDQTPPEGADFGINARYLGGASLSAQTNPTIPAFGQAVEISAQLASDGPAPRVDSAQALLRKPDGSTETIPLAQAGQVFSAAYTPTQAGLHSVAVLVKATTADGFGIDRAAFLSFEVQPSAQAVEEVRSNLKTFGLLGGLGLALVCGAAGVVALLLVTIVWWRRRKAG